MSEFNIEVDGGKTVRLTTAGKYCDRDILVTASGEETGSYDKGYAEGKQDEWNSFWDTCQDNGNKTDYSYAFGGSGWTDENFNPKYPIIVTGGAYEMFVYSSITDLTREGIVLDFSKCKDMRNAFLGSKTTKYPTIDLTNASACYGAFMKSAVTDLHIIVSDKTDCSTMLQLTTALVNLTVSGTIGTAMNLKDSSLLSAESVQSVIDALKDLTGATAQTLTFHKDVGAKLTDEQKATITAKNWILVY